MECCDIKESFIPVFDKLTADEKSKILNEVSNIEFLKLNSPTIREIDKIWALILFGESADSRL